jgi:hypothetical protein
MLMSAIALIVVSHVGVLALLRTVDSSTPLHIKVVVNPVLRVELSIGDDSD